MRILVTGSAGHLGEASMRVLRDGPHEAIGLDVLPSPFTTLVGSIVDRPSRMDDARRDRSRVRQRARARRDLAWEPQHDFASSIARVARGEDYRSELARLVGKKDYHRRA